MSKHTPGPWKRQGWAVLCKHGTVVCNVLPWDTSECREEDHANTRLIAAAPELLEALSEALADWDDDHFDEEYPYRTEWADKARAAIAKAKGEGT